MEIREKTKAAPDAYKGHKAMLRAKVAGFIAALAVEHLVCVCGSERHRSSSVNARIRLYF